MAGESDLMAVEKVISDWIASVNTNDAGRMLRLVSDDLELIPPGQAPVSGSQAHALLRALFAQSTLWLESTTLEVVVSGDWAFRRYAYQLTLTPRAGGEPAMLKGQGIHLLHRQRDGSWKVAKDIWN